MASTSYDIKTFFVKKFIFFFLIFVLQRTIGELFKETLQKGSESSTFFITVLSGIYNK